MTYTPQSLLKCLKQLGYDKRSRPSDLVHMAKREWAAKLLDIPLQTRLHKEWLLAAGLPDDLIDLIERGVLGDEIERSFAQIDAMNERLDAWEAVNPEQAARLPWAEARQAWKDAGRPRLPWWQALVLTRGSRPR